MLRFYCSSVFFWFLHLKGRWVVKKRKGVLLFLSIGPCSHVSPEVKTTSCIFFVFMSYFFIFSSQTVIPFTLANLQGFHFHFWLLVCIRNLYFWPFYDTLCEKKTLTVTCPVLFPSLHCTAPVSLTIRKTTAVEGCVWNAVDSQVKHIKPQAKCSVFIGGLTLFDGVCVWLNLTLMLLVWLKL